jgi:hypothetical protein
MTCSFCRMFCAFLIQDRQLAKTKTLEPCCCVLSYVLWHWTSRHSSSLWCLLQ